MAEESEVCKLFRLASGECSNKMPSGTVADIDPDCNTNPVLDLSQYKYYGEVDSDGDIICMLWKRPETTTSSLILPGLVFLALCVLLFIMIFKSVREKAEMRAAYEANYKKIQTSAAVDLSEPTRSRVPHSQFSCGGLTLTFQVSSNINTSGSNHPGKTAAADGNPDSILPTVSENSKV